MWFLILETGSTYIRWGRKQCPNSTSELVYSGKVLHVNINTLFTQFIIAGLITTHRYSNTIPELNLKEHYKENLKKLWFRSYSAKDD